MTFAQIALFSALALLMFTKTATAPRGIRNNNGGNIRWDGVTDWQGMTGADAQGFVIFSDPVYGVRAMAKILLKALRKIPAWVLKRRLSRHNIPPLYLR